MSSLADDALAFFLIGGYCGEAPSGTSSLLAGCRESVYLRLTYFFISLVAAVEPLPPPPSRSSLSRSLISLSRFSVLERASK